jgi:hypothetical protein
MYNMSNDIIIWYIYSGSSKHHRLGCIARLAAASEQGVIPELIWILTEQGQALHLWSKNPRMGHDMVWSASM